MFTALKKIFKNVRYVMLATLIAGITFSFSILLPNWKVVLKIIFSQTATIFERFSFVLSLFGSIKTNFTAVSATYTIIIALLFGMNVAMLAYYIRTRKVSIRNTGSLAGVGGMISGIFGIGCAACGTFILSSTLTLVGAGGLISYLPFGGEEFGILGVGLLGLSIYITGKKIGEPLSCDTNTSGNKTIR